MGRLAYSYTKDTQGNTTSEQYYSYSNRGEPIALYQSTKNSGRFYGSYASYYENGALKSIGFGQSYPSVGRILPDIGYGIDGEGRPISASETNGTAPLRTLITSALYDVASRPVDVLYGDGNKDAISYDQNTGRPISYSFSNNCQTAKSMNLGWNLNGTLLGLTVTDAAGGTNESCSYTYDELGRVTSDNCASGWQQTFSYDAFGNIQKAGNQQFSPGYYPQSNRYIGFDYDLNGNLLSDGTHAFTWDSNGLPTSVDTVSLTYNADGKMAEQGRGGAYTQVIYSPTGVKLALVSNGALQKAFVPLPGGSTAIYNGSGFAYFRRPDWLGSSRLATSNPTVSSDPSYAPFGEIYGSNTSDVSFTGQNQDTVTGLYDFTYREYNPAHGRWMSPDPAGIRSINFSNPQSFNRYSYAGNYPLTMVDPDGLDYCPAGFFLCYFGMHDPTGVWFGGGPLNGGFLGINSGLFGGGPGPTLQQFNCPRCIVHVNWTPGGAPTSIVEGPPARTMSDVQLPKPTCLQVFMNGAAETIQKGLETGEDFFQAAFEDYEVYLNATRSSSIVLDKFAVGIAQIPKSQMTVRPTTVAAILGLGGIGLRNLAALAEEGIVPIALGSLDAVLLGGVIEETKAVRNGTCIPEKDALKAIIGIY